MSNAPISPAPPRVEILEALRGFAALAVAWFHFTQSGLLSDGWLRATGHFGWLGVEMFFVISGFVIPYALHHGQYRFPEHFGKFVLKRVIRLDPPYFVAIVLALLLWYVSALIPGFRGEAPQIDPWGLLLHVGYLSDFFGKPWVLPVFWSLAIEFQYYLLMAVIFPLLNRQPFMVGVLTLAALHAITALIPSSILVFKYLGLFAMGIVTFWLMSGGLSRTLHLLLLSLAVVAVVVVLGWPHALAGGLTALLIAYVRAPPVAIFSWLGSISYSLYLVHVPIGGRVVNLGKRFADDTASQLLVLMLAMLSSVFAAWCLHRWVELPSRRWSARIRYGKQHSVAAPLERSAAG